MEIKGKNVLITGGASGIGKIMGRICLEKGAANLIVWDINPNGIAKAKEEFASMKPAGKVRDYVVDISNDNNVVETYNRVKGEVGNVDILINCAGVVRGNNTFDKQTLRDIHFTMDINATSQMALTLQIIPDMIKRNSGFICNLASAAGMLGVPKLSVYCASKWAIIGWTESMRIELKMMKSKVKVMSVAPYFINTGMFDGVNSKVFPVLDPEKTAAKIIRTVERGKSFAGIPFGYHFIRFWQAILPFWLFDIVFGKWFGIYSVMDHFTGRKQAPVK